MQADIKCGPRWRRAIQPRRLECSGTIQLLEKNKRIRGVQLRIVRFSWDLKVTQKGSALVGFFSLTVKF